MERFAEIRSLLRRRGKMIADFDLLVGTTVLYYDLTVLTCNKRHFKRIPDLKIYQPAALFVLSVRNELFCGILSYSYQKNSRL